MKQTNLKKLTAAAIFCAMAVVGSLLSFPVFGSKCSPVQHMVNDLRAVLLGPSYEAACRQRAAYTDRVCVDLPPARQALQTP